MRPDAVGLFWDDTPVKGVRNQIARVQPPIPDTGWLPPREFPNLAAASVIGVDTETYDPNLLEKGPGWARGDGHIVGVSIAADDDGRWYFPVRHTIEPEYNMNPDHVFAWLRDSLRNERQPKVGANLGYDLGWLLEEGVDIAGELVDVQHAEALLNERGEVNLDWLGEKYLGRGKEVSYLYQWCADYYGGSASGEQRANIWRAPPRLVGPYAEYDAIMPLQIARLQYPLLAREGLLDVLEMENGLIRLVVAMRRAGVTVNIQRAEEMRGVLMRREQEAQAKLDALAGTHIDVDAAASIARAFDALGLKYPRTKPSEKKPDGSPSFRKEWLEAQHNPVTELILETRKLRKLRGTFLESYILDSHVNGRVYGQFHLLRGDGFGTRSGRFSSSTPNLQNIPIRSDEGKELRSIYVPDYGHKQWRRYDYSQIEYRFLVHFAEGKGANEARQRYHNDPHTDYHDMVLRMVAPVAGWDITTEAQQKKWRKPLKNTNFGLIYGMGKDKLLRQLGLSPEDGEALWNAYFDAVPYAKSAMQAASEEASSTGIVRTILGRISRFDLWEPKRYERDDEVIALPYELAIRRYGHIRRAHTHKGLNRKLQGSAADLIKRALWLAWKQGIFAVTGVPRLTVHDELDFSDTGTCDEAYVELRRLLETAIPLRVPVKVDEDFGADWGATS